MKKDKISGVSETRLSSELPEANITAKTLASETVYKFKTLFREELEKKKEEYQATQKHISDPDYQDFLEEFFDFLVNSSGRTLMLLKNFGYGEALFYVVKKARQGINVSGTSGIKKAEKLPVYHLRLSNNTYSVNQVKYRDPAGSQYNDTV